MAATVAPQASRQRLASKQGGSDAVGEPFATLKRPTAAHAPQRVDRKGGVAHERETGTGGRVGNVGHVDLALHGRPLACVFE